METPLLHTNGSGYQHLYDSYTTALRALHEASDALGEAAPHARDYYPKGERAFERARHEHHARVAWVRDIIRQLEAIREAVQEQEDERYQYRICRAV